MFDVYMMKGATPYSRYSNFFNNIHNRSNRSGRSYPLYPLNTTNPDLDYKLQLYGSTYGDTLVGWDPTQNAVQSINFQVTNQTPWSPVTQAYQPNELFFVTPPLPIDNNTNSQVRVAVASNTPCKTDPDCGGGVGQQCNNGYCIWQPLDWNFIAPVGTNPVGFQLQEGSQGSFDNYSWFLKEGPNPTSTANDLNLRFYSYNPGISYQGDVLLCTGSLKGDTEIMGTDQVTGSDPSCKWRTDQETFACCTTKMMNPSDPGYKNWYADLKDNCAPGFMPGSSPGSVCPQLITNICENNWDDAVCKEYLQSFLSNSDVPVVVTDIVRSYINGQAARKGCGFNEYTTPNSSYACKMPDGKYRDDSQDDFLQNTIVTLCTGATTGTNVNMCDLILNQYCAQFTREDLDSMDDNGVLRNLCGCHLSGTGSSQTTGGLVNMGPGGKQRPPQPNQYPYPGLTVACDPICNFSNTLPLGGKSCASTVCVMDNVDINIINSNTGNVTLSQVCKGAPGGKSSQCYMSNVDINVISSNTGGNVLNQGCDACYAFCPGDDWDQDKPAYAVKVDCSNPAASYNPNMCGKGGNGGGGGGGQGGGGGGGGQGPPTQPGIFSRVKTWIEDHPYWSLGGGLAILIIFMVLITLIIIYSRGGGESEN